MRRPNAVLVKDGDSELYLAFSLLISCLKRGTVELEGALVTPNSNTLAQTFSQLDNE